MIERAFLPTAEAVAKARADCSSAASTRLSASASCASCETASQAQLKCLQPHGHTNDTNASVRVDN